MEPQPKRDVVFISHATPADNEFALWLALKLKGRGFHVWCDVLGQCLPGGEDFWREVDNTIRNSTAKFLYVLSRSSNSSEGSLKELAVAQAVAKKHMLRRFVVPVRIDSDMKHEDTNIELKRLQVIEFSRNWAEGLNVLLGQFDKEGVPRSVDSGPAAVADWWRSTFLKNAQIVSQDEEYYTNWFPITGLPPRLYLHPAGDSKVLPADLPFPATRYRDNVVSFASASELSAGRNDVSRFLRRERRSIPYSVEAVVSQGFGNPLLENNDAKNLVTELLNTAWDCAMSRKGLKPYALSQGRTAHWVPRGLLDGDRILFKRGDGTKTYRVLVGTHLDKTWHFAISGAARIWPQLCFSIATHIVFTSDGMHPLTSDATQHAARRQLGRNWWNAEWRDRLLQLVRTLADDQRGLRLGLARQHTTIIDASPTTIISPVSYADPDAHPQLDLVYAGMHEPDEGAAEPPTAVKDE
ncbi:toll/interleukin-1 receptor domain-containing protein [candidate division WOR-3 bacterium]|nr:toll/interleukin-1 receptor domain-containing protein [candidate division WOR-3 bacterium]